MSMCVHQDILHSHCYVFPHPRLPLPRPSFPALFLRCVREGCPLPLSSEPKKGLPVRRELPVEVGEGSRGLQARAQHDKGLGMG